MNSRYVSTDRERDEEHMDLISRKIEERKKMLSRLAEDETRMNMELDVVQRKRDQDRMDFIANLQRAETESSSSICEALSKRATFIPENDVDDDVNSKLFDRPDNDFLLRREEVLASMQAMLSQTEKCYLDRQTQRKELLEHIRKTEPQSDMLVERALSDRYHSQLQRVCEQALTQDIQKAAFSKLRAERDVCMNRLKQDVTLVEQQLCNLTLTEQQRLDELRGSKQQGYLTERRHELVKQLNQLKERQNLRQKELREQLEEMDRCQAQGQRDYWLIQYQRVLDRKPPELGPELEPEVYKLLASVDALQFLPNFQYHHIDFESLQSMTDEDLQKIGVYSLGVRHALLRNLKASQSLSATEVGEKNSPVPTAPPAMLDPDCQSSPVIPTAPPSELLARFENECCICQNNKCKVIFMQCGHVCTCLACSHQVTICPLCRAPIAQRVRIQQD